MKILELFATPLTESVDGVWKRLIDYKDSIENPGSALADSDRTKPGERCKIDADDEKGLKKDIADKLAKGWTESEIYQLLRWSEYFDDYTHTEDQCIKKMSDINKQVEARLGK